MRRILMPVALATAAIAVVGGAGVWSYRIPVIAWLASRLLERQQLGPVRLVVDAIDLHGFAAHDVALRSGTIRAREITATYSPLELAVAHLRHITITGLEVGLAIGPNGVEIGGSPLGFTVGTGSGSPIGRLHVDTLEVSDAHIALDSPVGPIQATISATLVLAGADVRSKAFSAKLVAPISGTNRAAQISAQELALEPRAEGGVRLRAVQATILPEDVPWEAHAIDGVINWQPERATAKVAIGRLVNRQQPMLVAPLSLSADASMTGPNIDFLLDVNAGAKSALKLEAKGRHDRLSNSGSASITMEPMVFHRGAAQPADAFPILGSKVEDVDGSVAIDGSLRWTGAALSTNLLVRLKDLAFAAPAAHVRELNGAIKIVQLWPPATPPGQALAATIEIPGLPAAGLRLVGELTATQVLKLERLEMKIAGGEITASPFAIDPETPSLQTILQVNEVDLAELTKLLGIDGLSGTGQLDGRIPISLEDRIVTVTTGRLAAKGPGLLRYQPRALPTEIATAGESVALALQALSDFHYESLSLDLDKSGSGEGTVLLRLKGNNPAVLSGQAFNFNIRLESNFDRLVDYALLSLSSIGELLRQAARRDVH